MNSCNIQPPQGLWSGLHERMLRLAELHLYVFQYVMLQCNRYPLFLFLKGYWRTSRLTLSILCHEFYRH